MESREYSRYRLFHVFYFMGVESYQTVVRSEKQSSVGVYAGCILRVHISQCMRREIIVLYLLGGGSETGNAIFGCNPHFMVLVFHNGLYNPVGQSVFHTVTIESQMLVVISRITDSKACSRCADPHVSFVIIYQTTDFIAGECFVNVVVKYIVLGCVDQ